MKRLALPLLAAGALLAGCSGSAGPTSTAAASPSPTPTGPPRQVQAVIQTDHGPADLIVGTDALFVGTHRGGTVQKIDPETNRVTATVAVGGQLSLEDSTTWGGLRRIDEHATPIWGCTNTDGSLHQVDTDTMKVTATMPAKCDGGWRTRIGSTLWAVPGPDAPALLILDLKTAKVLHRVPLGDPGPGWGTAVAAGANVLIGSASTPVLSPAGRLLRRSPVATPWLTSTGGRLYVMHEDGRLQELDPGTLAVRKTYQVAAHHDVDPLLVADDAGHLYYRPDTMHVFQVDTASGQVRPFLTLPSAEVPTQMAWAFGSLWVTNFDADTIWRVDPTV